MASLGDTSSVSGHTTETSRSTKASRIARAYAFEVQVPPSWSPPPFQRALQEKVTFACGQIERYQPGESAEWDDGEARFVFRGYIEFSMQITVVQIRDWISSDDTSEFKADPVFLKDREAAIRSRTDSSMRYKDPDDLVGMPPWSVGKPERARVGERTDMEAIREIVREHGPVDGIRMVAEQFPGQFVRYPNGITQLAQLMVPRVHEEVDFKLRPWQEALRKILTGKPHSRHIYWVEDGLGNSGKSRLSTFLCREMNAVELDGRMQDAAFTYTGQPIVIFDLARAVEPSTLKDLYVVAEKLKNGQIYSSKYQSQLKVFKVPHVVFFSNSPPPMGVWSVDRLQHIQISAAVSFSALSVDGAAPAEPELSGLDMFNAFLEEEKAKATSAKKRKRDEEEEEE